MHKIVAHRISSLHVQCVNVILSKSDFVFRCEKLKISRSKEHTLTARRSGKFVFQRWSYRRVTISQGYNKFFIPRYASLSYIIWSACFYFPMTRTKHLCSVIRSLPTARMDNVTFCYSKKRCWGM